MNQNDIVGIERVGSSSRVIDRHLMNSEIKD